MDEALLFSLDFATAKVQDCFSIASDEDTFSLRAERNRVSSQGSNPNLAIAVSSHGTDDVIVVLSSSGTFPNDEALIDREPFAVLW